MPSTTTHSVVLRFHSNLGEVVRFSIPRAKLDKTPATAQSAMEAMIANGNIITSAGFPIAIKDAEIISTQRTLMI